MATTNEKEAEALFAAASVEQQQRILDEARGKGWRAGNAFDILMLVSVALLIASSFTGERRLDAATAGFGILSAYLAMSIHLQRRIQALLRLIEALGQQPV